jgi:hypothetical protein
MTLLLDLMLADLERGLAIARDGHEVVPAWREGRVTFRGRFRAAPSLGIAYWARKIRPRRFAEHFEKSAIIGIMRMATRSAREGRAPPR